MPGGLLKGNGVFMDVELNKKKTLTLGKKIEIKKTVEKEQVKQSFAHGRSKTVEVEVRRKRAPQADKLLSVSLHDLPDSLKGLTHDEVDNRLKAVKSALIAQAQQAEEQAILAEKKAQIKEEIIEVQQPPVVDIVRPVVKDHKHDKFDDGEDGKDNRKKSLTNRVEVKKPSTTKNKNLEAGKKLNRNVLSKALSGDLEERTRSIASAKRAKQKLHRQQGLQEITKITREVIIPETITVGELANRMAVRSADVIKALIKLGMMVTINQVIDGDTAELICTEFGHIVKRVSESDIEIGIHGIEDHPSQLQPRAPVVTIMGHVDHGKTSLLDALRQTDVVSGEAGGITQHIGAYQITLQSGKKITFIDTPGHAAFSEMRARGANVTDIVVLVVAADDGIKEQTLEAINHAKAANVPIVVAINKIDKPGANPEKVRSELLQHGIVLEEYGGDVLAVEVSARQKTNLEKLEEAILLQAEILDLKSNPNRLAIGAVVEARIDKGLGVIATVLIQRGTLKIGDIFVAGTEWGKVRALINDHGKKISQVTPSMPVEVLGFNGVPVAGQEFLVVDSEPQAREIADYRRQRLNEQKSIAKTKTTIEEMMSQIASGETKELPVLIKADVQGSLEAIISSLAKLSTSEVSAKILHGAVGPINESDITLAKASRGIVIGFNVRANPQARDFAKREEIEIRYYSIIYNIIDDIKSIMGGLLAPTLKENFLGTAVVREVFNITKVGKVAGCYVNEGMIKRGAKARLLRDSVVIFEGDLKTLKRFKEDVKEVKEAYECGIAFENYQDLRTGDVIECFEIETISRQL